MTKSVGGQAHAHIRRRMDQKNIDTTAQAAVATDRASHGELGRKPPDRGAEGKQPQTSERRARRIESDRILAAPRALQARPFLALALVLLDQGRARAKVSRERQKQAACFRAEQVRNCACARRRQAAESNPDEIFMPSGLPQRRPF
jgi:hypothetical protein